MKFLLDTSVVAGLINYERDEYRLIFANFSMVRHDEIGISSIVLLELENGLHLLKKSLMPKEQKAFIRQRTEIFLDNITILPFEAAAARETAKLMNFCRQNGRQLQDRDACIAGHAISAGMTLVSADRRAFGSLVYPGLTWMDWQDRIVFH